MKQGSFDFSVINEPHELILSGSTSKIIFPDGEKISFSGSTLKAVELNFIKSVKSEIIKNSIELGFDLRPLKSKFNFFDIAVFQDMSGKNYFHNIYEIDLNNAYWNAALNLSLIKKSTYDKGMEFTKQARLVAVGSAASRKNHFLYDGSDYEYTHTDESAAGISSFFRISEYIGEIVSDFFRKYNLIMYWVDAVFSYEENVQDICRYLDLVGMPYKIRKIELLEYERTAEKVKITTHYEKNGEKISKKYQKKLAKNTEKNVFLRNIMKNALDRAKNR